ncbi:MAG: Hsp20/alpha crystallin family protein [Reyranella sp.]|nr:Hsp20/alpha crystallin family protein [Reyranella sp.]
MTETAKVPVKAEQTSAGKDQPQVWRPFETLRREVDRLFDDFGTEFWRSPLRRSLFEMEPAFRRTFEVGPAPAVDIVEKDNAYEVTADLPGFDEKNIEVKLQNGSLCIKGERKSEKEEKKKDYHLTEREFGSFERRFTLPEGVDPDKIEASLKKGVLTVTLPKKPEAQKLAKKIDVKAAA